MKHEFKQAVILCGGEGSRLGNITKKIPKPLIKVNGKPFLEHQIKELFVLKANIFLKDLHQFS